MAVFELKGNASGIFHQNDDNFLLAKSIGDLPSLVNGVDEA